MSRILRRVHRLGVYFVTTDTGQRRKLFSSPDWARILAEHVLACRDRDFYKLHAFVVMPDHLHVLLTPGAETTIEKAAQMIKGGSSRTLRAELGTAFPVWHAGFHDHWIRNGEEYRTRYAYISANPVAAKLVDRAEDYEWSSVSRKYQLDASPYDETEIASGAKAR